MEPKDEEGRSIMTEIRHAWCQMCGPAKTKCSMLCTFEDGRCVNIEGNPAARNNGGCGERTLCAKAHASIQAIEDPARLSYPLKRVGPKGQGRSAFERCSWDEAIAGITDRLTTIKRDHGPQAFGILAPQFFNVLLGDMSVVGPRPDLRRETELYEGEEGLKLSVKPGITGYAAVYGRNSLPWKQRLSLDVYYVKHVSFLLDAKVFFRTFATVLGQEGIYVEDDGES